MHNHKYYTYKEEYITDCVLVIFKAIVYYNSVGNITSPTDV